MAFLNWAGGKAKVLPHIVPHIPSEIHNYYEPFLGGGSVLLYVLEAVDKGTICVTGKFVCGDINKALIYCYQAVKKAPEKVIRVYEQLGSIYDACPEKELCKKKSSICLCKECFYHATRTTFNAMLQIASEEMFADIGAYFVFLNATCYRGLYRESKNGIMNSCHWTSRTIVLKSNEIREASRLFRKYDVQFVGCNYMQFFEAHVESENGSPPRSFVFLDPPYIPLKSSSLISNEYNKDGFNDENTKEIIQWMRANRHRFNLVFCNHATGPLQELCDQDGSWEVSKRYDVRRSMKYCGESSLASEVLISNVSS